MFIKMSQSGYNRHGEQFARGSFLTLFSHNAYRWEEQNNTPHDTKGQSFAVVNGDGFEMQRKCQCDTTQYYSLKYCPVHSGEYKTMPKEMNRKLYACVRHVSLRQCGHFMMGSARIAGQSVTVSGSYGGDGLPRDYEKLNPAGREKLVEVPAEIADVFWKGDGHNSAGSEGPVMRKWALETFKK